MKQITIVAEKTIDQWLLDHGVDRYPSVQKYLEIACWLASADGPLKGCPVSEMTARLHIDGGVRVEVEASASPGYTRGDPPSPLHPPYPLHPRRPVAPANVTIPGLVMPSRFWAGFWVGAGTFAFAGVVREVVTLWLAC